MSKKYHIGYPIILYSNFMGPIGFIHLNKHIFYNMTNEPVFFFGRIGYIGGLIGGLIGRIGFKAIYKPLVGL